MVRRVVEKVRVARARDGYSNPTSHPHHFADATHASPASSRTCLPFIRCSQSIRPQLHNIPSPTRHSSPIPPYRQLLLQRISYHTPYRLSKSIPGPSSDCAPKPTEASLIHSSSSRSGNAPGQDQRLKQFRTWQTRLRALWTHDKGLMQCNSTVPGVTI
jgi:hypothetical protein